MQVIKKFRDVYCIFDEKKNIIYFLMHTSNKKINQMYKLNLNISSQCIDICKYLVLKINNI